MDVSKGQFDMSFTLIIRFFCRELDNNVINDLKKGVVLRMNELLIPFNPDNANCKLKKTDDLLIFSIRDTQRISFFLQLIETPFDIFTASIKVELTSKIMNS